MFARPATLLLFAIAASGAPPGVSIERVFGPETPTGRYKHPASIAELADGSLYIAYYGGDGEYAPGTGVFGSRRDRASGTWSKPALIAQDPFYSVGNAVVWQAPDGVVWLWYVVRPGDTWSSSRIAMKISRDGAKTWSDASVLSFEEGTMVRGAPIVLTGGDYLLPVWKETGNDREEVGSDTVSFFLRRDAKTGRWSESSRIRSRRGNLQPAVAELDRDHLIAYCRRGGDYKPTQDGWIVRTESRDGGRTWTPGEDSRFPNPNAAVEFLRLRSGHLLLIYNDSMTGRTPLTAALSTDGDRTYPYKVNLAEGRNSYAYPFATQGRDGRIHLVFTSDQRTVVHHAVFEESALMGASK